MGDITTTLLSVPAIVAVVNILKGVGLPGPWAPVASLAIGALFGAVTSLVGLTTMPLAASIITGFLLGMAASGIHDVAGRIAPSSPTDVKVDNIETVEIKNPEIEPEL